MAIKVSITALSVLTLVSMGAFGADRSPETLKQAILRAVDLSRDRHVFGRDGRKNVDKLSTTYLPVRIQGTKPGERAFKVVLGVLHPGEEAKTTEALIVEFPATGIVRQSVVKAPGLIPAEESRLCGAVKTVLAKYLNDDKSEVSVSVCMRSDRHKVTIVVSEGPLIEHDTMFILNYRNEIETVMPSR